MAARRVFHSDEERRAARKETLARYNHSEKGAAARRRHEKTAKAKARYERYRATGKYAATRERANKSRKPSKRAMAYKAFLLQTAPEKIAARAAVAGALRRGLLNRPETCFVCLQSKRLHAHHHLGYEPDRWLDVLWLCVKCHRAAHG